MQISRNAVIADGRYAIGYGKRATASLLPSGAGGPDRPGVQNWNKNPSQGRPVRNPEGHQRTGKASAASGESSIRKSIRKGAARCNSRSLRQGR